MNASRANLKVRHRSRKHEIHVVGLPGNWYFGMPGCLHAPYPRTCQDSCQSRHDEYYVPSYKIVVLKGGHMSLIEQLRSSLKSSVLPQAAFIEDI